MLNFYMPWYLITKDKCMVQITVLPTKYLQIYKQNREQALFIFWLDSIIDI